MQNAKLKKCVRYVLYGPLCFLFRERGNVIQHLLKCKLLVFFSFLHSYNLKSQDNIDSIVQKNEFINLELNRIGNDSSSLTFFYDKLNALEQHISNRVTIVHIGDSHIQADHFSGKMRINFQKQYGNAGRGLIFPYRVARTNEPGSFNTSSNVRWDARRNVIPGIHIPIGIGGVAIETADTSAEIKIRIKNQDKLDYSFNRLTLFHMKSAESYDFAIYDSSHKELAYIKSSVNDSARFSSSIPFNEPLRNFSIKPCARDSSRNCARIYGMLMENGDPGILYNMIGVNGAEFRHYNQSEYFAEQMPLLNPDLIIISLGTNEAYIKRLNKVLFYSEIDSLVMSIRLKNPGVAILLTTPGDSYRKARKGRVKNQEMKEARNTIIEYCGKNNVAYWDLYEIMGGFGSMSRWYAKGLASKDKLHFNGRGYRVQGALLYKALNDSYLNYKKRKANGG